jgi:hypothetical protein
LEDAAKALPKPEEKPVAKPAEKGEPEKPKRKRKKQ